MTVCAILMVLAGLCTMTLVGSIGLGRGSHNHHEQLLGLRQTIQTFKQDVRASRQVVGTLGDLRSGRDCLILNTNGKTIVYQVRGIRLERGYASGAKDSVTEVLLREAARCEFRYNASDPAQADMVVLDIGLRQRLPERQQAGVSATRPPAIFHYPIVVGLRGKRHAPQ